jgi:3-hydroxyacyl-[acyl-carrier-protein] dehydratase
VLTVDPGRAATAVRNIPGTLTIFDSHFPRFPVLPGVLLLDSMAQLAALALGFSTGQWRLTRAEAVRFRHFVRPGDQTELAVRVLDTTTTTGDCDARVTVDGRLVATARRLRLAIPPAVTTAVAMEPAREGAS